MATPAEQVDQASACVSAADFKGAARLLGDAVYSTSDPELLRKVKLLAEQGLAKAGRFGKGQWQHLLEEAGDRLERAEAEIA